MGTSWVWGPPCAPKGWKIAAQLHAGSREGFLNLLLQGKILTRCLRGAHLRLARTPDPARPPKYSRNLQKPAGTPRKSWGPSSSPHTEKETSPRGTHTAGPSPHMALGIPTAQRGWRASTSTLWGEDEFLQGFHHLHPTATPNAAPGLHLLLPRAGNLKEFLQEGFRGCSPSRRGAGAFGADVTDSHTAPATRRREGKAEGGDFVGTYGASRRSRRVIWLTSSMDP